MTVNMLIEAISAALNSEFGDEYEIHMEEIRQDLKEPCFFIQSLKPKTEQFFGVRYHQRYDFCIQYFPKTLEIQRECNDTGERMYRSLEYIVIPDGRPVRGTEMNYEVLDSVLNFYVNYDSFVIRAEEEDHMEEVTHKVVPKEDFYGG